MQFRVLGNSFPIIKNPSRLKVGPWEIYSRKPWGKNKGDNVPPGNLAYS